MKRWIGVGIFLTTIVLYTALTRAAPSLGETLSCGLGLPPGAPGFAESEAQQELEVKTNGYRKVCDANLDRYRISFRPLATTMSSLPFQPADLSGTQFAHFASLGAMIESVNTDRSRLYRGFRTPEGHTITLFEHDMSVDGSSAWRDPKDEPERINGLPARLVVLQTPAGKAISHLSWFERRRAYELWIDANVVGTPLRERLFALAASLPPSVPGCPNEPPPKQVRVGPDGFPEAEAMPLTLTQAEMDAMLDKSRRSCK
jgi:hypothetical protein